MNARFRDPFAKTRRENFVDRMTRQREGMTVEQVESAMARIIRQKPPEEPITLDDFRLKNLPMDTVKASFRRVLQKVQNEMALERA